MGEIKEMFEQSLMIRAAVSNRIKSNLFVSVACIATLHSNSRRRISAILKIVKSTYLNEKSSDLDEIWYTTALWYSMTVT